MYEPGPFVAVPDKVNRDEQGSVSDKVYQYIISYCLAHNAHIYESIETKSSKAIFPDNTTIEFRTILK